MLHLLGLCLFSGGLAGAYVLKKANQSKTAIQTTTDTHDPSNANLSTEVIDDIVAEEKAYLDKHLSVTGVGTGLAFAGQVLASPSLGLLSLPLVGYSSRILLDDAYQGLQAKEIRITILDSVAVFIGVATGYYALTAFASLVYLISLKLLAETRNNAQQKMTDIFSGHPPNVWLLKDGIEINIPFETVAKDDLIVIHTGETIPIDGVIEAGNAQIDQHMLTGEAQPEEKTIGQPVFATTLVISGRITVRVEKTGADTVAANITKILANTDDYISVLQTRTERLANNTVLPTVGISALGLLMTGRPMTMAVILSSNFSEVMQFSAPLTMLNYLNIASQSGVLIKDGRSLEQLLEVDTVVFDKTGTLTLEQPHVGAIYPTIDFTEQELLFYTAAAEYRQSHPIAKAILTAAASQEIQLPAIDDAEYRIGLGISVNLDGDTISVGSARFMRESGVDLPDKFDDVEKNAHKQGYSVVYTAVNTNLCGAIELHPTLRPEAIEVVQQLHERGLKVYILSGDHEEPVKNLALQLGIDDYIAETLPEDKAKVIDELQQSGRSVCFIGDGINDSIALKKAAVSVSIQDASQIAVDNAQIILMNKNLHQIVEAFDIAHKFNVNQKVGSGLAVAVPSLICMGGAIFLRFNIGTTLSFYAVSVAVGLSSATYPYLVSKFGNTKHIEKS